MTRKISIIGQIAEMEREIAQRQSLYPRLVREGKMRQAESEMLMDRAVAILNTLIFCQNHEADIREFIARKKGAAE